MSEEEIDDILEEIDETWGLAGKKAIVELINKHEELIYENISLQKELENLKEVDRQICCEELITKDKYQEILKENEELKNKLNSFYGKSATKFISKNIIRKRIDELLGE